MDKIQTTIFAALVIAILSGSTASAQPAAANIVIVSGNGQLACQTCSFQPFTTFYPFVVKVTDANGAPITGKTVNWQVTSSGPSSSLDNSSTVTNSKGIATVRFVQGSQGGSASQPFLQSTVLASVDSVSATFYVTEALTGSLSGSQLVGSTLLSPTDGTLGKSIGGPAGSTGTVPIQIHIDGQGVPVPNISVRLVNTDDRLVNTDAKNLPSAVCAAQAGADPGSVLTDANGNATCNPVFGPVAGTSRISVLVGGLDPAEFDQTSAPEGQRLVSPVSYKEYANIQLVVTPGTVVTPATVKISSGNNQTISPGQSSGALVVLVADSTGATPVGNASVTFSVSPSTGATLSATTATSNPAGLAQTTLTIATGATGPFSVKAALTSNPSAFVTFTVSTPSSIPTVVVTSLAKLSGDAQTVPVNQAFGAPLVVQVNGSNAAILPNVTVNFSISGPGTLTANSAVSDSSGRAQTGVRAGGTPGTITVIASASGFTQTFTLTVAPPGPTLTTASFANAAGRAPGLSPCSLATVTASGLAPGIQGLVLQSNSFGPWATTLGGDTVTVNSVPAPIYSVGTVNGLEQITFQVPCEAPVGSVPVTINVSGGAASANIVLTAAGPGIFETAMSDGVSRAVVVRPTGEFVSLQNPARRGEVVRVLVTGLGPTTPTVPTGALPVPGSDALVAGQVIAGVNNGGARVVTARLSPNLIGVYEVAFQIPSDALTGNDVVLSIAVNAPGESQTRFSNGSKIPIQ